MKNIFRKISILLIFLSLILFVAACSQSKEETRTFTAEINGMKTEVIYTFIGDKVTKQETINFLPYATLNVTTKEEAEAIIAPIAEQYEGFPGLIDELQYGETELIETLTIDYQIVDIEKIKEIPGMSFSGDTSQGVSMKQSEKILLEQGYTEVKK